MLAASGLLPALRKQLGSQCSNKGDCNLSEQNSSRGSEARADMDKRPEARAARDNGQRPGLKVRSQRPGRRGNKPEAKEKRS